MSADIVCNRRCASNPPRRVAIALLGALADQAPAQQPASQDAAKQVGTCVAILTDLATAEAPTLTPR